MLIVGLVLVSLLAIYYMYWIHKWNNPKYDGVLPPGSMGLPLIGETLELLIPSYSLDLHPFIKKRIQRYGPIFRSNVAGRPIIISVDPEFNHHIISQEGRLVEIWYLDTFSKIFVLEGELRTNASGYVHKYMRGLLLSKFGSENLRLKLLPQIENMLNKTLSSWSLNQENVEVKQASSVAIFNFTAKVIFDYDAESSTDKLSDNYAGIMRGLLSFPLNFPGTTYHQCVKDRDNALKVYRKAFRERLNSSEKHHGDVLDLMLNDMDKEKFLKEDFFCQIIFGALFASFESISLVLTLMFKFFATHPSVVAELMIEHERILKNRQGSESSITWDEYKSMTFTHQVINETLRLGAAAPGLMRKAIKDVEFKGYTIPAGWPIMAVTSARHVNPEIYKDPFEFNPWRWKDLDPYAISKNFTPFGGGTRQCAGADYSRVVLSLFLHILVTKYRWTIIKEGKIKRGPILGFENGIHIKFFEKQ